jgi:hypothetical protein
LIKGVMSLDIKKARKLKRKKNKGKDKNPHNYSGVIKHHSGVYSCRAAKVFNVLKEDDEKKVNCTLCRMAMENGI